MTDETRIPKDPTDSTGVGEEPVEPVDEERTLAPGEVEPEGDSDADEDEDEDEKEDGGEA